MQNIYIATVKIFTLHSLGQVAINCGKYNIMRQEHSTYPTAHKETIDSYLDPVSSLTVNVPQT